MQKNTCIGRITAFLICLSMMAVLLCACGVDRAGDSRIFRELCSQENFNLIQNAVRTDLEPTENDTLRLTPEEVLSDGRIVWILFTLEHLGGEDLSAYNSLTCDFEFTYTDPSEAPSRYSGSKSFGTLGPAADWGSPEMQPRITKAQEVTEGKLLCFAAFFSQRASLSAVTLKLTELSDGQASTTKLKTELVAEIPVEATLMTMEGADPSGRFQKVELSPLGLRVDINDAWEVAMQETGKFPGSFYDMTLIYRDGTEFHITAEDLAGQTQEDYGWFGNHLPNGSNRTCIQVEFTEQFVDAASVKAIVIDGVTIPLSKQ